MVKLIAFDLDGTLTPSKEAIEPNMLELVIKLLQVVKVGIISGGSMHQFEKQIGSLLNLIPNNPIASKNLILLPTSGSEIFTFSNNQNKWELLSEVKFPEELKEKVNKAFEEILKRDDLEIPQNPIGPYLEDRDTQITFSALGQEAPIEIKKDWDQDQTKRQKIKKALEEILGNEIEIGIAGTTSIDFLPYGTNKATGLQHLLKQLNLAKKDMIFVGDAVFPGGNDYAPFEVGIPTEKIKGPQETAQFIEKFMLQLGNESVSSPHL